MQVDGQVASYLGDVEHVPREVIQRNRNAFRIFTLFKKRQILSVLSEKQKEAFLLIPYFLHTDCPTKFGYIHGARAPMGIYGFKYDSSVERIGKKYFTQKDKFADITLTSRPAIEFLSIMGSIGSLGFTDKSDLDYWVMIADDMRRSDVNLLKTKLRYIEDWSMSELGVEVHFFILQEKTLRNSDFGDVDAESCGSALGKLLKDEYFRGSIHVAGRVPTYWAVPANISRRSYEKTVEFISRNKDLAPEELIDVGSLDEIPLDELLGGTLWQINKGIGSPFKSAMKLGLILSYVDEKIHGSTMLSEELKTRVHENPNHLTDLDAYKMMADAILAHFERKGNPDDLDLMRECFFLKVGARLFNLRYGENLPPDSVQGIMLAYVRSWGWSRDRVYDLERFPHINYEDVNQLKVRYESFMTRGFRLILGKLAGWESEGLRQSVKPKDQRKLINRLVSVYQLNVENDPFTRIPGAFTKKLSRLYGPFLKAAKKTGYTIREVRKDDGRSAWELYGKALALDEVAKKSKLRIATENSPEEIFIWLYLNDLVHERTRLSIHTLGVHPFGGNIKRAVARLSKFHKLLDIPPLDFDGFAVEPKIRAVGLLLNFTYAGSGRSEEIVGFQQDEEEAKKDQENQQNAASSDTRLAAALSLQNSMTKTVAEEEAEARRISDPDQVKESATDAIRVEEEYTQLGARHYISSAEDPLNYGKKKECIADKGSVMLVNTWGEISLTRVEPGPYWFPRVLAKVVEILCSEGIEFEDSFALSIGEYAVSLSAAERRVNRLVDSIYRAFSRKTEAGSFTCFVTRLQGETVGFVGSAKQITIIVKKDLQSLLSTLIFKFPVKIGFEFDSEIDEYKVLKACYDSRRQGAINVFFVRVNAKMDVFIVDEMGYIVRDEIQSSEFDYFAGKTLLFSSFVVTKLMQTSKTSPLRAAKRKILFFTAERDGRKDSGFVFREITDEIQSKVRASNLKFKRLDYRETFDEVSSMLDLDSKTNGTTKPDTGVLRNLKDQIAGFRKDTKHSYRPFLTSCDIDDEDGKLRAGKGSLYFHLKRVVELKLRDLLQEGV
ncbi:MAG: class I adenylate cyclase [Planctomycetes bacterium]|nr:class I adenylate cyclase [Planctomycetota bacterium]